MRSKRARPRKYFLRMCGGHCVSRCCCLLSGAVKMNLSINSCCASVGKPSSCTLSTKVSFDVAPWLQYASNAHRHASSHCYRFSAVVNRGAGWTTTMSANGLHTTLAPALLKKRLNCHQLNNSAWSKLKIQGGPRYEVPYSVIILFNRHDPSVFL